MIPEDATIAERLTYVIGLIEGDIGDHALAELMNIVDAIDELEYRLDSLDH